MSLAAGSLLAYGGFGGQRQPRQRRERPQRPMETERQPPKRELSPEGAEGYQQIQQALSDILNDVNVNRQPAQDVLEGYQTLLDENKRYALAYDDSQRVNYILLQAWTDCFLIPKKDCSLWAAKAFKLDQTSHDAWASQALLSMLKGKKAIALRPPQPGMMGGGSGEGGYGQSRGGAGGYGQGNGRQGEGGYGAGRGGGGYGAGGAYGGGGMAGGFGQAEAFGGMNQGVLDFNLDMLVEDMTGLQYKGFNMLTASGQSVSFEPGREQTVCLLLWNDEVEPAGGQPGDQRSSLQAQRGYFEKLFNAFKDNPNVRFAQVNSTVPKPKNTDSFSGIQNKKQRQQAQQQAQRQAYEEFINNLPTYDEFAYPTIVAVHPDAGGQMFAGADRPFLLVLNSDGKVNYAGTACGFAPAFVLTHLTGKPLPVEDLESSAHTTSTGEMMMPGMEDMLDMMRSMPQIDPNAIAVDPNVLLNDPNLPAMIKQVTSQKPKPAAAKTAKPATKKELTAEDCVKAEKLLAEAQLQIDASRKIRGKSPEKGINAARKVLADYPNTKYAEQAREWLRKVPYRYKDKYQLTNEELGY